MKLKILVMVAALLSCSPPTQNAKQSEIRSLEVITGLNLCSSINATDFMGISSIFRHSAGENFNDNDAIKNYYSEIRNSIISKFDAPQSRCISFNEADPYLLPVSFRRGIVKKSGFAEFEGRFIPVIVTHPPSANFTDSENDLVIIIRVGGGPGAAELFPPSDEILPYYGNFLVLDIFYTGQGFNILHPNPSFEIAASQVQMMIRDIRLRNPNAQVIALGESLGARITVRALQKMQDADQLTEGQLDKVILLSPPLATLQQTGAILRRMAEFSDGNKGVFPYRIRHKGGDYNDYGTIKFVNSIDIFNSFAEKGNISSTLYEDLEALKFTSDILLVIGSRDERISPHMAHDFVDGSLGGVEVFTVPGMNHQFSSSQEFGILASKFDSFIFN